MALDSGASASVAATAVSPATASHKRRQRPDEAAAATDDVSDWSLAGMPGVDSLAAVEVALCEHLRLLPYQYLQVKAAILNVAITKGLVDPAAVGAALQHIDVLRCRGVYNFCLRAGLLPAPSSRTAAAAAAAASAAATLAVGSR